MASRKSSRASTSASPDPMPLSASDRYTSDRLRASPGDRALVPSASSRLPWRRNPKRWSSGVCGGAEGAVDRWGDCGRDVYHMCVILLSFFTMYEPEVVSASFSVCSALA
ncbi:unnamed protein product [Ectocarpus sp. CCAP 1310/34]|nr:unnamed protein product [Ectocarpus sp. CCAP 1310/34]